MLKVCSKCGEEKPHSEFSPRPNRPSGVRSSCKECNRISAKEKRNSNPALARRYDRAQYEKNRERKRAYNESWKSRNPDKMKEAKRRCRSTPKGRIEANVRGHIHKAIKLSRKGKSGRKTFDILGYTPEELIHHLERQFTVGMSWDNYGSWHIDHIIPLAAFNYSEIHHIDFGRAWALVNLRPLWAFENMSKGDKLAGEFQPSLNI